MVGSILRWGLGLIVLVLIGVAVWLWDPHARTPSYDELTAEASNYSVDIVRDDWGVPHIYGARDRDTAFGIAYAHAEDDFETIQEVVAATRGNMARYRGAKAAPTDYIVALLSVWETVDARYETDVPSDVKAMAEAYAAGVNLYAAENPDVVWKGLAPFTAEDVIAGFIFKTPFFYGLDSTLLELFGDDRVAELAMDPGEGRQAFVPAPKTLAERGSNAFAVSAERSGDGKTRLFINSHQPMTGPVAWWEAHVVSEEGLDITGGLFPGTPVILHGFNQHLGWANTVSKPDLTDVYRLEVNPVDDGQYRLDGKWTDFEVREVTIKVGLWGPFAFKAKRELKLSKHGPVIESEHGTYAIRYAGQGEIRQLEQYYRLNKAESLAGFLDVMAMNALPSINYIYGDKDGNIGFIHNGQYPERIEGWDWLKDLPGTRSDLIWSGYRPASEMPILINPQSGFIFNANNTPYSATDGIDNLRAEDFPPSMGLQTNQTNRALRILEMTDGVTAIDREALLEIKFDKFYAQGSQADEFVQTVLAQDWDNHPELAEALNHLRDWDYQLNVGNRHAALGALTILRQVTEQYTGLPSPTPKQAFIEAVDWLTLHHGRIDPEWGDVNRLVRGDLNIPIGGGSGTLRSIHPAEIRDDGELHATAGDTWMALVEWDEAGNQTVDLIHQFGSATLDETSPHYADQAPLFANENWRSAYLTREEVLANATRTYSPGR